MTPGQPPSVADLIANIGDLPPSEQAVGSYLSNNLPGAALLNLQQISARAGVSTATVTRFARRLGYSGFKEFNSALRSHAQLAMERPMDRMGSGRNMELPESTTLSRRFHLVAENTALTRDSLDPVALKRAVELISDESRPLYVGAIASGEFLMGHFASLAAYLRGNMVFLGGGTDHWPHTVAGMTHEAVVLVSSVDRCPTAIKALLTFARRRGATTIWVSNWPGASGSGAADINLRFHNHSDTVFRTRTSLLAVLELLLDSMAARLGTSTARAEDIEEMFALLNTHETAREN